MGYIRNRKRKKVDDPRILNWGWGYLEADFQRFYNMDLNREVFRNDMSMRRLLILLRGLPAESAFGHFYNDKTNRDAATYDPKNLQPF